MKNSKNIWESLLKFSLGLILVMSFLLVKMKYGWDPLDRCSLPPDSILIESITLSDSVMNMEANNTQNLLAQIKPANATNKNLKWSSSDTTVVIADPTTGWVTATDKGGECIITAAATDNSGKSANIRIKVNRETKDSIVLVDTIIFPKLYGEITLNIGSEFEIDAKAWPVDATNKILKWKSDKEDVATVNNGVVTGKSTGDCIITASSADGGNVVKSIKVHVQKPIDPIVKVTSIEFDKSSLSINIGDKEQIVTKILPMGATNKTLKWKSNNEGVAIVNNGVITGKGAGKCTITATSTDGGNIFKSIEVHVRNINRGLYGRTLKEKIEYALSYINSSARLVSKQSKAKELKSLFAPGAYILVDLGIASRKEESPSRRIDIWCTSGMKITYKSHKENSSGQITELTVEENL